MSKILQIIPSFNKGGAERIALDICIELQHQGHEVQIVTLDSANKYNFLTESLQHQVVQTTVSLSLLRKNQVDVRELQTIIDEFQPDVIHSHLFESEINLAFCKIPINCKRVLHFHDNMKQMNKISIKILFNKTLLTNYYERKLVLKNLKERTIAIGISEDSIFFIKENLPKKVNKKMLPNAINTVRFYPNLIKQKQFILIMIGSFVSKKGQQLAIETISELKERNQKIKLQLLGDGYMKAELIELSKKLGVYNLVDFKGLVDYPESYLQESKLYLHTASYEPFGLALIEAMACGLPVVCTDGIGNRDLINEGENGFMIWKRDPKLLADKIQFLIENENERIRMGENARLFAQDFGIENYVSKLLEIYRN